VHKVIIDGIEYVPIDSCVKVKAKNHALISYSNVSHEFYDDEFVNSMIEDFVDVMIAKEVEQVVFKFENNEYQIWTEDFSEFIVDEV
jgi:hypothetical protein